MRIHEADKQKVDMALPVYQGLPWPSDCTCAVRRPARALLGGEWKSCCLDCGSLRHETGT